MHNTSTADLLQTGREHHQAGRVEMAEAFYRRAVERDETDVQARLHLGIVLQELGRAVEAAGILGQLVVDDPGLSAGWVQLARAIASQGYAWEAHEAIAKALKGRLDADSLVAVSMLQLTLLQDIDAAESTSRRAVEMTPGSVSAWMQLGQVLVAKGQTPDAAAAYRRALANEPGNAMAAFFLAALGTSTALGTGTSTALGTGAPPIAPPQYVRALFDGCAEQFDAMLVGNLRYRTPQMLDRMFSQWLQRTGASTAPGTGGDLVKPMVMLDAGCGTGLCGLWLARYRGRLIGVDLSRKMIAEAQAHGVYDELVPGEVVEELQKRRGDLDLILAADVLVYIGDLAPLFTAAAAALREGGVFVLSVEAAADADYVLLPTQRFAHSMGYLRRLAASNGLAVRVTEEAILRLEKGADVRGYLLLAEKMP